MTMKQNASHTIRILAAAALLLWATGAGRVAWAGPFADEIAAMATDHYNHDHSGETNADIDGAGIDAGCESLPNTNCPGFQYSILLDSDFTGATFAGADLDDITLLRNDFTGADMRQVEMRRATVRGGDFESANFSDAVLTDSYFRCIDDPDDDGDASLCPILIQTDFTRADLTGTFISATFSGDEVVMSGAIFRQATLVDAVWGAIAEPCIQTDEENNLWSCIAVGPENGGDPLATVESLSILNTEDVTSDIRGSEWHDLSLLEFDLIGTRIAGASFADTTIEEADFRFTSTVCRLDVGDDEMCDGFEAAGNGRTDFSGATIRDTRFDDADLSYADFTDATLERVTFDNIQDGCSVEPDPEDATTCDDCVNFAGAFDGQVAQGDGSYNISIQGVDWDRLLACSAIVGAPLVDDLSHMQLDAGSFRDTDVTAVGFEGSSLVGVSFRDATIDNVSFDDAILTGANFNGALNTCDPDEEDCTGFASATFDGATLTGAVLSNTHFVTGSFDEADLDGAVAVTTDFSGASFVGTASSPTSMVGVNLTTSSFDGATFSYADLTDAEGICNDIDGARVCTSFVDVVFTNSELVNANFNGADFSGASFPGSDLSGARLNDITVAADTSFNGAQIDGIDLGGVDLQSAAPSLFQGKLDFEPGNDQDASDAVGVDLSDRDVSGFDFSDLELVNWNFESATLDGADFSGAGTDLTGASFESVQFDTVFSTLVPVENDFFSGTDLTNADLQDLDLSGFDLSNANLEGTRVSATLFVDANLSGARLVNLDQICDEGGCADITGAMLSCAEIRLTDHDDFIVVDDNMTPGDPGDDVTITDARQLFQFTDADLSGLQFTSQTLSEYDFSGLDLSRANFAENDVRLADFSDTNLAGTLFTDATICATSGDADCADFSGTDLVGSTDCNVQEGANFTGVDFVNAPRDLFEGTIDASAECVIFASADLSLPEDPGMTQPASGFDFSDFTNYTGAVLAGASVRHQRFDGFATDFFSQFAHAPESVDSLCSDEDDDVANIDDRPDFTFTDFSCAYLNDKEFTNAVMNDAQFVRTELAGASFDGATLAGANFTDVDFSTLDPVDDADLFQSLTNAPGAEGSEENPDDRVDESGVPYPNLQLVNFSFANLELTSGNFNLNHVDLLNANLSGARFVNVDLRDAILDAPVSLCDDADGDSTTCSPLLHSEQVCVDITGAMVEGASFRFVHFGELFEFHAGGVDAARLFFQDVDGENLRGTNFTGSNIAGLDFSGLDMTDAALFAVTRLCDEDEGQGCAIFDETTFASSDVSTPLIMTSIDFDEASIAGARFDNVDLSGSDLNDVGGLCTAGDVCVSITGKHTRLFNVVFDHLDLTGVDFGANGTDDAVTQFAGASMRDTDLTGLVLHDRDFTNVDFSRAILTNIDLEGSILSGATFGCNENDADDCSVLDGAKLCGVDASSARFEGSFDGTDFLPSSCSESANLRGAVFTDSELGTLDLSQADLEAATFDASVKLCNEGGHCLTIDDANLVGVDFTGVDFNDAPADWFQAAGIRDLGETIFVSADLSGKLLPFTRFDQADFTSADLRDADLRGTTFDNAQFASGGSTDSGSCTLASGTTRVDLRGADLRGADFSRARNFHRGCVRMNSSTVYDANTRFPAGFDYLDNITLIPEPRSFVLQAAALLTLVLLAARRRHTSPA